MKIAIMQPYLFPYIGYFQLIQAVDKFVILDDVNFIKKGWINRNKILVNGREYLFTVPLKKISQNKLIKDLELDNNQDWQQEFLKTIELNYKKAPYFTDIYELIENIILSKEKKIAELILKSLKVINTYLEIATDILVASRTYNNFTLKGETRLIDICKKEKADNYINPIGGIDLYSKLNFSKENIILNFLKSENIIYPQFNETFVPCLSIIDILMFNSKKQTNSYLSQFQLI